MPTLRRVFKSGNNLLKRAYCVRSEPLEHPVITTDNGQLRGKTAIDWKGGQYYSFQGIPYAKPPSGELRFKAPVPADPWSGVKDALKEGNACYSRHFLSSNIIGSEDCLYLNVYSPELTTSLKPVMVWIHGGGFIRGSSNTDLYGPEFLISENVVVVTINYRLGLFGFASFEDPLLDVPGNAGLKDQVLALQWVKNNISKFGGDPSNVTIFGESSGGSSVHYLMLSPLAKGLFHRAISQSGTVLHQFAEGQRTSKLVAKALQLETFSEKDVFNILNKMCIKDLHSLQEKIPDRFFPSERKPIGPVVEPSFLSDKPVNLINSGNFNQVPLMIGYTSNEGMYLAVIAKTFYGEIKIPKDYKRAVPYLMNLPKDKKDLLDIIANEIKEFYYGKDEPTLNNMLSYYALNTDNYFLREINTAVKLHTKSSVAPVYYYRMSLESKLNMMKKTVKLSDPGMCHADDLGYFFKNSSTPDIHPNSIEDVAVRKCIKLWTNFARYGNPNSKEEHDNLINVKWKPTEVEKLHFIDIGDNLTVGVNPEQERLQFWEQLFKKYDVKLP